MRFHQSAALAAALFFFAACGSGGAGAVGCAFGIGRDAGPAHIELNTAATPARIEVVGLTGPQWMAARQLDSREAWAAVFKVAVAPDQPPMLGDYSIDGERIVFTPMFPLDPGRQYHVSFTPLNGTPITTMVGLPATHTTPTTVVSHVYPSGEVVPENQLRLYIHFSAHGDERWPRLRPPARRFG